MAAAYLANAIAWRRGGNVAVITPSLRGGFARNVVQRVAQQVCGAQRNGPYAIRWERSEDDEVATLVDGLNVADVSTAAETLAALERLPRSGPVREAGIWVGHQARVGAKTRFTRAEIEAVIARQLAMRRQRHGANNHDFAAMTVQQAKNREFEGVVVLWPYQVGGDAEHKRRLLYNAITRARRWCTIVVQNPNLLQDAPF
jgi:superfamily I DNA/RNA helicase